MEYTVHGSKNQNDSNFKLTLSEFAETNVRRFDLELQILITHWLSVTRPRYLCEAKRKFSSHDV